MRVLVQTFEGPRQKEFVWCMGDRDFEFRAVQLKRGMTYGWVLALMEMLVDPVLVRWVPSHVVEQYTR